MKRIALAVAGAALAGLAACSNAAAPAAAPASPGTARVPVSCVQQYHKWALGQGKGLIATFNAVSSAGRAGHVHLLRAVLERARPDVARATRHPIPACADPRGYWDVLLMHVNAATANAGSASSVRAAMKGVPEIDHLLVAELKSIARAD